jgi:peroxiredoxin
LAGLLSGSKRVVLAFYTEASTPRCAQEIAGLKDEYATLQELGAEVVGISADGLKAQRAFDEALGGCPFPLASDEALEVSQRYEVVGDDGKRSQRAIFVIDTDGTTLYATRWYQPGNPTQFMEIFKALGMSISG